MITRCLSRDSRRALTLLFASMLGATFVGCAAAGQADALDGSDAAAAGGFGTADGGSGGTAAGKGGAAGAFQGAGGGAGASAGLGGGGQNAALLEYATGLTVLHVSAPPTGESVVLQQTRQDTAGNTSFRLQTDRALEYVNGADPYLKPRDRDLGQVFVLDREVDLRAITLRVGPAADAVSADTPGAKVSLQLLKVDGVANLTINDNGTTEPNTNPYITWTKAAESDDYVEGLSFSHFAVLRGATLPVPLKTGDYLRWEVNASEPIVLEAQRFYAFVLMFDEPAKDRRLAIANYNNLPNKNTQKTFGFGIRREGHGPDGDYYWAAGWELRPELPLDPTERLTMQPGTWGRPDVDTFRDLVFYLEAEAR